MNSHLLDPKFIMLAGVVILVIAGAGLAVRARTPEYDCRPAAKIRARVRTRGADVWVRTKSRSETSGSSGAGWNARHPRS